MNPKSTAHSELGRTARLWLLLLANYAAGLVLCRAFIDPRALEAPASAAFLLAVWLTYPFFYLLPAFAVGWLALLLTRRVRPRALAALAWGPAVLAFATVQMALLADQRIHDLYGFHWNGFVWNLMTTPGGIASLGAGSAALASVAAIGIGVLLAELATLSALRGAEQRIAPLASRRAVAVFLSALIVLSLGERLVYAGAELRGYTPVLQRTSAFPFYLPLSVSRLALRVGAHVVRRPAMAAELVDSPLVYPLRPIVFRPDAPRWNVVVLCAESLRADALSPEHMPATWRFANDSTRFTRHVSGGNGTRMGVFGLFYGLPGPYWFRFLAENRGPVLLRTLLERDYDVRAFTSDDFSYPEFDRTVFADVAREHLREGGDGAGWQRDRQQVAALLDFLANRDRRQPFFLYMFFESTHAPYGFPIETAVEKPYLDDLNYVTMNLQRDIEKIRNRDWNAVRHLDTQIERVLAGLREQHLLASTIVVITGDHGEEFLEKGRWGHNSAFSEEQIRVPLVLWVPGRKPAKIERLTSHLDVPATLLALLGTTNPPEDYEVGRSLFAERPDDYVLVSDWSRVAYVDRDGKQIFSMRPGAWAKDEVTDRNDRAIADPEGFLRSHAATSERLLQDLSRFTRHADGNALPPPVVGLHDQGGTRTEEGVRSPGPRAPSGSSRSAPVRGGRRGAAAR